MGHVKVFARKPIRAFMEGIHYSTYLGERYIGAEVWGNKELAMDVGNPPQDGVVEVEIRFIRHIPAEECTKK